MLTGSGLEPSRLYASTSVVERGLQALRNSLISIYRQRFGLVPARVEDALRRLTDLARLETLVSVFMRGSADEIGKAVSTSAAV